MEKIQWLEGGGCLIDGKVWISVISPVRTLGFGYEVLPMYFDSLKAYTDALQKPPARHTAPKQ